MTTKVKGPSSTIHEERPLTDMHERAFHDNSVKQETIKDERQTSSSNTEGNTGLKAAQMALSILLSMTKNEPIGLKRMLKTTKAHSVRSTAHSISNDSYTKTTAHPDSHTKTTTHADSHNILDSRHKSPSLMALERSFQVVLGTLVQAIEQHSTRITKLETETTDLKDRLTSCEAESTLLAEQIDRLFEESNSLRQENEQTNSLLAKVQLQLEDAQLGSSMANVQATLARLALLAVLAYRAPSIRSVPVRLVSLVVLAVLLRRECVRLDLRSCLMALLIPLGRRNKKD